MSKFYTAVHTVGNTVVEIGYENGKRVVNKTQFQPTLFVPSLKKGARWHSLEGVPLEAFQPGDIGDCREAIDRYSSVANFKIYGNTDWTAQYIGDQYPGEVPYVYKDLRVGFIDIETESENGFPSLEDPNEQLSLS